MHLNMAFFSHKFLNIFFSERVIQQKEASLVIFLFPCILFLTVTSLPYLVTEECLKYVITFFLQLVSVYVLREKKITFRKL